jgi:UDP-galactose transporter
LAFYLFTIADPGTINLVKASSTFISALILLKFANRHPVKLQWFAIVFQVLGLVVSQYDETNEGGSFGIGVYLLIGASTLISACCGCYNDHITKSTNTSLHILNAYMYGFGFIMNFVYYGFMAIINEDEPGLFQGYNGWGLGVLICNSLIGLAITAVYKYGDAIVKCFAQSVSTSILVLISWLLFGASIRVMTVLGGLIVFLATYIYMFPQNFTEDRPELDRYQPVSNDQAEKPTQLQNKTLKSIILGLLLWSFFCLLFYMVSNPKDVKSSHEYHNQVALNENSTVPVSASQVALNENATLSSINNTVTVYENATLPISALIEFTSPRFEREAVIRNGYQDHFRTTTLNFGTGWQKIGDLDPWNNHTQRCGNWYIQYHCLGELSKGLQDQNSKGFLFFHFDFWVQPKAFSGMDFDKIWIQQEPKCAEIAITNGTVFPVDSWFWWKPEVVTDSLTGLKNLALEHPKYKTIPKHLNRVCRGWSDFFYIPKSLIKDFGIITKVFSQHNVFHEFGALMAIDILRREYNASIMIVDDCWGGAVNAAKSTLEVISSRCGHKLPLQRDELVKAHFYEINGL